LLFIGDAQAAIKSFETSALWASSYPDAKSQNAATISLRI
jgi:hypothetical protein